MWIEIDTHAFKQGLNQSELLFIKYKRNKIQSTKYVLFSPPMK